mmetsp:Transcript_34994/g.64813  ORF Transcript_34994/g.64813 Transcript_34994/m.64813 type:complete len:83 (-) Transcript_34994:32-280(-)
MNKTQRVATTTAAANARRMRIACRRRHRSATTTNMCVRPCAGGGSDAPRTRAHLYPCMAARAYACGGQHAQHKRAQASDVDH